MVSQEIEQKGYLLGLVLNGMNKTLEITLQGIILHWQGNGQDNLIVLFISKPPKLQEIVSWTTPFYSLTLSLLYTQTLSFILPRTAFDMMWGCVQPERKWKEGQSMKYFGSSMCSPSSGFTAGLVFQQVWLPAGMTVLVGCLYFPPLPFNTLKRYRRGLQKPLLLWCSCSDCSSNSSDSPRKAADKGSVGDSRLWGLFLFFKGALPFGNSRMTAGQRGDIRVNICHCPPW